jgi:hypothetical protein
MTRPLLAPSVGDLITAQRSKLSLDAAWLSATTLRVLHEDLRAKAAVALKANETVRYDKIKAADESVHFVLRLLDQAAARAAGGMP